MMSFVMMMSNVMHSTHTNNYAWSVTCLLLETNFVSSVDEKHPEAITPLRRWYKTSKGHTFYVVDVKHPKDIYLLCGWYKTSKGNTSYVVDVKHLKAIPLAFLSHLLLCHHMTGDVNWAAVRSEQHSGGRPDVSQWHRLRSDGAGDKPFRQGCSHPQDPRRRCLRFRHHFHFNRRHELRAATLSAGDGNTLVASSPGVSWNRLCTVG